MNTLLLPKGPEESVSNFIIIGANGSGKSHLGVWIEENQGEDINVLRISAQRALTIPKTIVVKSEEAAWNKIYYGNETEKNKGSKVSHPLKRSLFSFAFACGPPYPLSFNTCLIEVMQTVHILHPIFPKLPPLQGF